LLVHEQRQTSILIGYPVNNNGMQSSNQTTGSIPYKAYSCVILDHD